MLKRQQTTLIWDPFSKYNIIFWCYYGAENELIYQLHYKYLDLVTKTSSLILCNDTFLNG